MLLRPSRQPARALAPHTVLELDTDQAVTEMHAPRGLVGAEQSVNEMDTPREIIEAETRGVVFEMPVDIASSHELEGVGSSRPLPSGAKKLASAAGNTKRWSC